MGDLQVQCPDKSASFHKDNDKKALSKSFQNASFLTYTVLYKVRIEDYVLIRENTG